MSRGSDDDAEFGGPPAPAHNRGGPTDDDAAQPADVAELFRAHADAIYRYLVRLTGGHHAAAQDAVQQAFLRYLEAPPDRHPRAWLYRVATNGVREWAGTERRRERLLAENAGRTLLPEVEPGPDERTERWSDVERIRRALAGLPERDRTVLLMREEGFKHREIAEAVGTTTGSVGTMISRSMGRLAAELRLDEVDA